MKNSNSKNNYQPTKTNLMRNILTFVSALIISVSTLAGNHAYEEAMESALNQLSTSQNVVDFQNTANSFNRIANIATDEWLPDYYQAQCYILMSFIEQDHSKKDPYLDIAEKTINRILEKHPKNAEAYALQAFMYTGRLVVDPMTRGQEYSSLSMTSIKTSLAINPTNPRALYLQLSNEIGTAQFFKTDTSIYCERINALITNWDSYNEVKPMFPSWGKKQVLEMKANCK